MPFHYFLTAPALRQIKKLSPEIQRRILEKIKWYCLENPFKYAEYLLDSRLGDYRFRIGDYRVIFDKKSFDSISILRIGHRREIYRR